MKIAIIGAGISGLSLAYYIRKKKPHANIEVFEKNKNLGGQINSYRKNDFLIETAANGFLDSYQDIINLAKELGINTELIKQKQKRLNRYIAHNNQLHLLPTNPKTFLKSKLFSIKDKVLFLLKLTFYRTKVREKDTIEDFFKRQFNQNFVDNLITPFLSGVFANKAENLLLKTSMPKLFNELEKQGNIFKILKKNKKTPPPQLSSFKNGMVELINALAKKSNATIHLNTSIDKLYWEKQSIKFQTEIKSYDYIFSTCNTPQLEKCLSPMFETFNTITYVPCTLIYVSLDKDSMTEEQKNTLTNSFGYLNTEKGHKQILGSLFNSCIYENRCPDDKILIEFFVGGFKNLDVNKNYQESITKQLKLLFGITKGINFIETIKWQNAIAQYDTTQKSVREILNNKTKDKKVYFLGNSFYGISIANCIQQSKIITNEIF